MLYLPVTEIFSSVQGEGPYVGARQIFLRLPKCNLDCPYCDTENRIPAYLRLEKAPGSGIFTEQKNPVNLEQLPDLLQNFDYSLHHAISITGGEPLLWADELQALLPQLKKEGLNIYLETNGTLPEQLRKVISLVDVVSMDIKLPYADRDFWAAHQAFLRISKQKEVFVKIVVQQDTLWQNLERACDLIADVDPQVITVLQPVTGGAGIRTPEAKQLLEWQGLCLEKLKDVRVVPQTHVFMGLL